MNKTPGEAGGFARSLAHAVAARPDRETVVAPPFVSLTAVREALMGTAIGLAAQNCHDRQAGAFTGEVSAPMLAEAGCSYVIVGHSERRLYFHETDLFIRNKVTAVLEAGMRPILCVGETLEERERGSTFSVVARQVKEALQDCSAGDMTSTVVAYEPVWAIGTGRTASPDQAQEVHLFLRSLIGELFGGEAAAAARIIYGGSVTAQNVRGLMAMNDIDGALVGGASLSVASFSAIANY